MLGSFFSVGVDFLSIGQLVLGACVSVYQENMADAICSRKQMGESTCRVRASQGGIWGGKEVVAWKNLDSLLLKNGLFSRLCKSGAGWGVGWGGYVPRKNDVLVF